MNHPKNSSDKKQSRRKFATSLAVTLAGVPFASSVIGCNQPSRQGPKTSIPNPASQSALAKARRPLLIKSDPDRLLKDRPGQTRHRFAVVESEDKIEGEQPNNFPITADTVGVPLVYVKKMGAGEKPEPISHPRLGRGGPYPARIEVYSFDGTVEAKVLDLVAVKLNGPPKCSLSIWVRGKFKLGDYQGAGDLQYKYEVKAENTNQPYISRILLLWGEAADIEQLEPDERKFGPDEFDCLNIELDLHFCEEKYCNCDQAQLLPRKQ